MLKQIRNKKGMTILEVLVAAGLASIVSLGIATMMQNSMVEQKKSIVLNTLKELRARMEFLIRDQNAWNQTINCTPTSAPACPVNNSSALFDSLRANSPVSEVAYATPEKIILMDAAGIVTNLLGPASTTGNGYTETGAACTTFSATAGAGVDACPISYRLLIGADCGSGTTCTNPQLKIVARLVYNPSTTGTLNKFRGLIAQVAGSSIADTVLDLKFDASVKRTSSQVNRNFTLASMFTGTAGSTCATRGAGTCSAGAMAVHPLTVANGWDVSDTNGLVTAANTGVNRQNIRFNETGLYACVITVPAFATQGFTAELYKSSAPAGVVASASTISGFWSQSVAVIDTKFNVTNTADTYVIRQRCDAVPTASAPGDPTVGSCSLGMITSTSYGTNLAIVTVACYKADRTN